MAGFIDVDNSLEEGRSLIHNVFTNLEDLILDNSHVQSSQESIPSTTGPPSSLITSPPSPLQLRQTNPQDCQNLITASVNQATVEISRTIIALNATFSQQLQQASISASNGIKSAQDSATSTIAIVSSSASVATSSAFSSLTLANLAVTSVNSALTSAQASASLAVSSASSSLDIANLAVANAQSTITSVNGALTSLSSASSSDVSTLSASLSLLQASITSVQASASAALAAAQSALASATGSAAAQAASIIASAVSNTPLTATQTSFVQPTLLPTTSASIFLTPTQIALIITGAVLLFLISFVSLYFLLSRLRKNKRKNEARNGKGIMNGNEDDRDSYLDEKNDKSPRNVPSRMSSTARTGNAMVLKFNPPEMPGRSASRVSEKDYRAVQGGSGDGETVERSGGDEAGASAEGGQWPLTLSSVINEDTPTNPALPRTSSSSGWPFMTTALNTTPATPSLPLNTLKEPTINISETVNPASKPTTPYLDPFSDPAPDPIKEFQLFSQPPQQSSSAAEEGIVDPFIDPSEEVINDVYPSRVQVDEDNDVLAQVDEKALFKFSFAERDVDPFIDGPEETDERAMDEDTHPQRAENVTEKMDDVTSPDEEVSEESLLHPTVPLHESLGSRIINEDKTEVDVPQVLNTISLPPQQPLQQRQPSPTIPSFLPPQKSPTRTPNPSTLALLNPPISLSTTGTTNQERNSTMPEIDILLRQVAMQNEAVVDKPLFWTDFRAVQPEFIDGPGGDFGVMEGIEDLKILSPFRDSGGMERIERVQREERVKEVLRSNSPVEAVIVEEAQEPEPDVGLYAEEMKREEEVERKYEIEQQVLPVQQDEVVQPEPMPEPEKEEIPIKYFAPEVFERPISMEPEPVSKPTHRPPPEQEEEQAKILGSEQLPPPAPMEQIPEPQLETQQATVPKPEEEEQNYSSPRAQQASPILIEQILESTPDPEQPSNPLPPPSPIFETQDLEREISPLLRNPQVRNITSLIAEARPQDSTTGTGTGTQNEEVNERQERGRSMIRTSDIISARNSQLSLLKHQDRSQSGSQDKKEEKGSVQAREKSLEEQARDRTLSPLRLNPITQNDLPKRNASTPPSTSHSHSPPSQSPSITRHESPLRRNPSNPPFLSSSTTRTNSPFNPSPHPSYTTSPPTSKSRSLSRPRIHQNSSFTQNLSIFQGLAEKGSGAKEASNEVTSRAIAGIYIPGSLREMAVRNLSRDRERDRDGGGRSVSRG